MTQPSQASQLIQTDVVRGATIFTNAKSAVRGFLNVMAKLLDAFADPNTASITVDNRFFPDKFRTDAQVAITLEVNRITQQVSGVTNFVAQTREFEKQAIRLI